MMKKSPLLKLLIIDDSEDDALSTVDALRRGGYEPNFLRVDTRQELQTALESAVWDVVVADYNLKSLTCFDVLNIIHARGIDGPILLVSEEIGEARTLEAMNAGFNDFITKGQSFRLTQSIKRELRNAMVRREREEALHRSKANFRLLSETAEQLLKSKDIQVVVNDLCTKTMEHLNCDVFFNYLIVEKAGCMHLNAFKGIPDEEAKKIEWLDFGVAVCGCAAMEAIPIIAENIPSTPDPRTELVKSFGVQAYACHPLMVQDKPIGTLSFGTKNREFFSREDIELMKRVADQVATAMERSRLLNELQRSKDDLESRVLERTAELEKINAVLKRSNMALEDFAHIASHDLQEPLRKIISFSERLAAMKLDPMGNQGHDFLKRIHEAAARMRSLVQDLVKFSRLTSGPGDFKVIDLGTPVKDAVTDLTLLLEENKGRVEVDKLPKVMANENQMRQIFQNLIGNALKYRSDQDPVIRISNGTGPKNEFHEIRVSDNGMGFDEIFLDKIFKPFERLHGKGSPYPGTGMGLAICKKILDYHGGSITAESNPDKGSTFIVRLPKMGRCLTQ